MRTLFSIVAAVFIMIDAGCLFSAIGILGGHYRGVTSAIQQTGVAVAYLRGAVFLLTSVVSVGLGFVLIGLRSLLPEPQQKEVVFTERPLPQRAAASR